MAPRGLLGATRPHVGQRWASVGLRRVFDAAVGGVRKPPYPWGDRGASAAAILRTYRGSNGGAGFPYVKSQRPRLLHHLDDRRRLPEPQPMASIKYEWIRSLLPAKFEYIFSHTSLNRASTLRLTSS